MLVKFADNWMSFANRLRVIGGNSGQLQARRALVSQSSSKTPDQSSTSLAANKKSWQLTDTTTHTGQTFSDDDYRLPRFINKQKEVSTHFAIDLIAEIPPIACKERYAVCNGGGGPLGHPKVFINLDDPGNHSCGYCGLRFFMDRSAEHH